MLETCFTSPIMKEIENGMRGQIDQKQIWGLEFGNQGITPHINLLVENTKDEWDKSKLHHFFAKELPRDLAKCVAQRKLSLIHI